MAPSYPIKLIPLGLSNEETVLSIASSLEYLNAVANDIFQSISQKIASEQEYLEKLTLEIQGIESKVEELRNKKTATIKCISSSHYPGKDGTPYTSLLANKEPPPYKRHPISSLDSLNHGRNSLPFIRKKASSNPHLKVQSQNHHFSLKSAPSALLFNTSERAYLLADSRRDLPDPLFRESLGLKSLGASNEGRTNTKGVDEALASNEVDEDGQEEVPELDLPDDLNLDNIALSWDKIFDDEKKRSFDTDKSAADSSTVHPIPPPPPLPGSESIISRPPVTVLLGPTSNAPISPILSPIVPGPTSILPANISISEDSSSHSPVLSCNSLVPTSIAPTSSSIPTSIPPPPASIPPPPPPPPIPSQQPPIPPPFLPKQPLREEPKIDNRTDLLSAIRNAGGVCGAGLKSVKDRKLKSPMASQAPVSNTNDLMKVLANNLRLRRKGMSGVGKEEGTETDGGEERVLQLPTVSDSSDSTSESCDSDW